MQRVQILTHHVKPAFLSLLVGFFMPVSREKTFVSVSGRTAHPRVLRISLSHLRLILDKKELLPFARCLLCFSCWLADSPRLRFLNLLICELFCPLQFATLCALRPCLVCHWVWDSRVLLGGPSVSGLWSLPPFECLSFFIPCCFLSHRYIHLPRALVHFEYIRQLIFILATSYPPLCQITLGR